MLPGVKRNTGEPCFPSLSCRFRWWSWRYPGMHELAGCPGTAGAEGGWAAESTLCRAALRVREGQLCAVRPPHASTKGL